jgi:hypothetical protein
MIKKRVSFSDINDVFIIPDIDGTKKMLPRVKTDKTIFSGDELIEQISTRKKMAIWRAKAEFIELERKYNELQQYVASLDEDDDDYYEEYELYLGMIEENFFDQSVLTRKIIALIDK